MDDGGRRPGVAEAVTPGVRRLPRQPGARPGLGAARVGGVIDLERIAFIRIHATHSNLLISHVRAAQNRFPLLRDMP